MKRSPSQLWVLLLILTIPHRIFAAGSHAGLPDKLNLVIESGHSESVEAVAVSPDNTIIASGSQDNTVKLWRADTGMELKSLTGHTGAVLSVAFSRDGKMLASGSADRSVKLWNPATGTEIMTLHGRSTTGVFYGKGHDESIGSVSFGPDGKMLATGSSDDTVKLWDLTGKGEWVNHTFSSQTGYGSTVVFSPDGKLLASGSKDHTIRILDVASRREVKTLTGHTHDITSIVFNAANNTLVSGSFDDTIKIFDLRSGSVLQTLSAGSGGAHALAIDQSGKILASGSYYGKIVFWDTATGKESRTLDRHTSGITGLTFTSDGRSLVSGSRDQSLRMWSAATGEERRVFQGRLVQVTEVLFSPDGRFLVSRGYSSGEAQLWDLEKTFVPKALKGHSDSVWRFAFSPDSKLVATGSLDNKVILWDTETGTAKTTLTGHSDRISSIQFSSDGKKLATGSWDHVFKIWNTDTWEQTSSQRLDVKFIQEIAKSFSGMLLKHYEFESPRTAASDTLNATITENSKINLFDKSTGAEVGSMIIVGEHWIILTSNGRFDTSQSLDSIAGLHWVVNDKIAKPIPFEAYMRQYFEPNLLSRMVKCIAKKESDGTEPCDKEFKPLPPIADIKSVRPGIRVTKATP